VMTMTAFTTAPTEFIRSPLRAARIEEMTA
jgi:hypothetical protein